MLITFSCNEYENITMFGDVAKQLLTMMGQSGAVPGAIVADDIPDALSRLQKGIEQEKLKGQNSSPNQTDEDDDDKEPQISLANRALPLINMLKAARDNKCNVMWK